MNKVPITVISPLFVMPVSWLIVLILYIAEPVEVLYSSDGSSFFYVITLQLLLAVFSIILGYKRNLHLNIKFALESSKGKNLAIIFFASALLETVLKGLPPIFTGADYATWGISGLHGFINILGLYISYWYFLLFLTTKEKRTIALIVVLLVIFWQVMVLNRAIIVLNLIGLIYLGYSTHKFQVRHMIVALILILFLMGAIGDLRGMAGDYIFVLTNPKPWAMEMGVGFVWVVTYFTTAISNLIFNLEHAQSNIFSPLVLINEFIPNMFKFDLNNEGLVHYDGNFNASTIMRPSILAFGILGPIVTVILLIIFNLLNEVRKKTFDWVIFTTFFASCTALSCFENTIFTPWLVFTFFLSLNFSFRK